MQEVSNTGKIIYRFRDRADGTIYVNLIANYSCTNDCFFCSRPRSKEDIGKPNVYEAMPGQLFLPKSPSLDEIINAISQEIMPADDELCIVGLGEPLLYFPKVVELLKRIKEKHGIRNDLRTRINTNGLVKLIYPNLGENAAIKLANAGLDAIRVSVNAINSEEYNALCRSKFSMAFSSMIGFVKDCINAGIDTYASFVIGFERNSIKTRSRTEYVEFANSLGLGPEKVITRKYV